MTKCYRSNKLQNAPDLKSGECSQPKNCRMPPFKKKLKCSQAEQIMLTIRMDEPVVEGSGMVLQTVGQTSDTISAEGHGDSKLALHLKWLCKTNLPKYPSCIFIVAHEVSRFKSVNYNCLSTAGKICLLLLLASLLCLTESLIKTLIEFPITVPSPSP